MFWLYDCETLFSLFGAAEEQFENLKTSGCINFGNVNGTKSHFHIHSSNKFAKKISGPKNRREQGFHSDGLNPIQCGGGQI